MATTEIGLDDLSQVSGPAARAGRLPANLMDVRTLSTNQVTIRDSAGREVIARFRVALIDDIPAIESLIALSARGLSQDDYREAQIEAALGTALGVDSQLIRDGTYFVAEADGTLVACGGWSWRKTLFGGDVEAGRQPESLDPVREAARIRGFFVHPGWARQGLGRAMLELCEAEAGRRGFRSAELMATLPGERLYRSCGYASLESIEHPLPGGLVIRFVPMRKVFRLEEAPSTTSGRGKKVTLWTLV